ncbi:uncharacterized protein [Dermacentor andersoni]|uniref:uncharacterized protein n=1 Tax=Dermacentor andersoni TaxID=34620 RepID=UPI003B3A8E76
MRVERRNEYTYDKERCANDCVAVDCCGKPLPRLGIEHDGSAKDDSNSTTNGEQSQGRRLGTMQELLRVVHKRQGLLRREDVLRVPVLLPEAGEEKKRRGNHRGQLTRKGSRCSINNWGRPAQLTGCGLQSNRRRAPQLFLPAQ